MLLLRPGDEIANCRILSLCGSGGMGIVYLAEDFLHRKVALKIVAVNNAERELRGILQYVRAAEQIPGMVRIFQAEIIQEQLVYTMEAADPLNPDDVNYVPKTLAAILKLQGRLPPRQALEIVRSLGEGLRRLHEVHLIHRDIKPENVIFINGVPKFCDPGLVCFQDASISFCGTLGYLPRECFNGENLNSPDRDLYALGMLFYVTVTGEIPARYPRIPLSIHVTARKKLWPLLVRVCSADPRRRFASAADFLAALPEEIPDPDWLDRLNEAFREYMLLHPRFLIRFAMFLLLLLICGTAFTVRQVQRSRQQAAYREKCRQEALFLEQKFKKNSVSLAAQLDALSRDPDGRKYEKSLMELPADPVSRLRRLQALQKQLTELALRMVSEIPAKTDDETGELLSSRIRSLLSSPLGSWLPEKKRRETEQQIVQLEQVHITRKTALRPGHSYLPGFDFSLCFVYVPAGVYRDRKGKPVHIRHAFWCGDTEIPTVIFSKVLGEKWLFSNREMPQVRIGWNDLIDFCRALTIKYREAGYLPRGYIFRPLTAREWYWAYRNAWDGIGKETGERQPAGRAHAVYFGTRNRLGIYNLNGNVSEMTLPAENERIPNSVFCSGSSYAEKASAEPPQKRYLKLQHIPPYVGARIAVAKGDLDFFEREHWYMEDRPLYWKDRVYQCLDGNTAIFTLESSLELCELLGGRLTAPDDPGLLKQMRETFWELESFPVTVDAAVREGKLVTLSGTPYRHLRTPSPGAKPNLMLSFRNYTVLFGPDIKCCGFICDWNREEYARRTELARILKSRCIAHTFRTEDKVYALVLSPSILYPVRQIAMLLGARLAEPRTPEIRERIRKELAPWKKLPVFLGGSWKFDRWVLADGSELKIELKHHEFRYSNGFNGSAPGLRDGEFCSLQKAQGFLLEFPLR